jgi:DNA modification methylase
MNLIELGDCRVILENWAKNGVKAQMCVTSPPYFGLRDYGNEKQIGLEKTSEQYIKSITEIFSKVRDVLSDNGTLWLNIGDSYGKDKQLQMIPARVAIALQKDGWILRQDIIWNKTNAMPSSVKDRCTTSHEYIFLFSKSKKYLFNNQAIKEPLSLNSDVEYRARLRENKKYQQKENYKNNFPKSFDINARNKRSVWNIPTKPFTGLHCAPFPPNLIEPCILAGTKEGDTVLDPFMGSGTTALVALKHNRNYLGCELNTDYFEASIKRVEEASSQERLFD